MTPRTVHPKMLSLLGLLVAVAVVVPLLVAPAARAAPTAFATEPLAICVEGTEDAPLELRWKPLPKPDSLTTLAGGQLPLTLHNHTAHTLFVTVAVAGALDALREEVALGVVGIAPFTSTNVAFDLSAFSADVGKLAYAGRLVARALARRTPQGAVEYVAYTPHAYVHPQWRRIVAYRTPSLLKHFGAGDFAGRKRKAREWADKRGITLLGIGPAARGLQLSENDGGPREDR
ncbi:MAG: hypothetical protein KDJ27_04225 [Gammaproteobacteria bacterium]|nr:hypothetical protein [Gammaproteobacteria bacterium]